MVDPKIGSSVPSNIQTTDTDSLIEIPPELELQPEVSTAEVSTPEDPQVTANTEEAMNKAGSETKGFMDTSGEYLKRSLGDQLVSLPGGDFDPARADAALKLFTSENLLPDEAAKEWNSLSTDEQQWLVGELMEKDPAAANELGRQLDQSNDPKAAQDFWNATADFKPADHDILNPSVMQFASPMAVPKFAKAVAAIKLTAEQQQAKADLEKSPAWKVLSDAEKTQVTKNLSKVSGQKLIQEVDRTKERFQAIETLSNRGAWGQLSSAQQQKIADQVLKLSGTPLKNEMTKIAGKFDSIEKMSQHGAWSVLSADQKAKLADPVLTLSPDKLKTHLTQTQDKLDSLESLSKQASWKALQPAQLQTIADQILKVSPANLKQTTQNVQSTVDFIASLKNNNVDSGKTLDNLLKLEAQNPKSYQKMTAAFTEAQNQINGAAAKDKQTVATDIRDMVDFSLARGIRDKRHMDGVDVKGEITSRFLRQYKNDPADFHKARDLLKNTPNALLVVHWWHSDRIGVGITGTKPVTDADWNKAKIPAGEETRFKHAIGNLLEREGKYDDLNAYDDGLFSLGIRQWSTHEGSLIEPLEAFQKANPQKFAELLPGITIQHKPDQVLYNGKSLTVQDPVTSAKKTALVGSLTQSEIIELSDKFNKLGKDTDFQKAQLQVGIDRINTVLGKSVGTHTIGDYVKSDRGLGQIISFDAGRPSFIQPSFAAAVKDVAADLGLKSAAPSRQELLDALKLKLEGDKAKKIEPDKDFLEKLQQKYGKDILDKLKTEDGRSQFLEKRLTEGFKDRFLEMNNNTFKSPADTQRFRERFNATEKYYDKL